MISFGVVFAALIVLWIFIYTVSYGVWEWKKNNRFGAAAVFTVALSVPVLPFIVYYLRG